MKTVAKLLLILFIAFLSTPALVTIIKKECNTAMFFNMSEEEHSLKGIKLYVNTVINLHEFTFSTINQFSLIQSENLRKHDNVSFSIFSPPPNFI